MSLTIDQVRAIRAHADSDKPVRQLAAKIGLAERVVLAKMEALCLPFPPQTKLIPCLGCDLTFPSEWIGHRIYNKCKALPAWRFAACWGARCA